jgi:hypothetical protein
MNSGNVRCPVITTIRDFRPVFSGKPEQTSDNERVPAIGNCATANSDPQLSCGGYANQNTGVHLQNRFWGDAGYFVVTKKAV